MLACPRCACHLEAVRYGAARAHRCPRCGGHAATYPVVRDAMEKERWQRIWGRVRAAPEGTGVHCPGCGRRTAEVHEEGLVVDTCLLCHLIWFDHGELPDAREEASPKLSPEAAEALGRFLVARPAPPEIGPPDSFWQRICGWLGLPFEVDVPSVQRAYVTASVAVALVVVHLVATANGLDRAIAAWGFVPDEMGRHAGATWVTSFFLHAGWLHLLSNVYFLVAFGDNVEEDLGVGRYLLLLFSGAVFGCLAHAAYDPRRDVPLVGASSGISAVLFYYAFRFPKARIGWALRVFAVPLWWFRMTTKTAFALWLLVQLGIAWSQVHGASRVSALGHLGGVLAGVLFLVLRRGGELREMS